MGADISIRVFEGPKRREVTEKAAGVWDDRNYAAFGWLAGVRNYSGLKVSSFPKAGLPDWIDDTFRYYDDCDSVIHFTLSDLLAVDYDQIVEDRRVTIDGHSGRTCPAGEGVQMSLREFLGAYWFKGVAILKAIGDPEEIIVIASYSS